MGIVPVASLAARVTADRRDDDIDFETHELGRERRQAIEFSLCVAPFDNNVFPLHIPKLSQSLGNASVRAEIVEGETALRILCVGFLPAAAPGLSQPQPPPRRLEGLKKIVSSLLPTEVLSAES